MNNVFFACTAEIHSVEEGFDVCGTPAANGGAPLGASQTFSRYGPPQANVAQKAVAEMKLIGFGNLLPYKDWLADKPWNLVWVRWFLGVALFPLFLMFWASTAHLAFESIAFFFGIYFALMWAVVLYFMLKPRLGHFAVACRTSLVHHHRRHHPRACPLPATPDRRKLAVLAGPGKFLNRSAADRLRVRSGSGGGSAACSSRSGGFMFISSMIDSLSTIVFLGCVSEALRSASGWKLPIIPSPTPWA